MKSRKYYIPTKPTGESVTAVPILDEFFFNETDWNTYKRKRPCQWYSLRTLFNTFSHSVVADHANKHMDYRTIQTLLAPEVSYHDYSGEGDIWVDYMADTGDGFDATYTMFNLLARDELRLEHGTRPIDTKRGRVLVLGGDEVYPLSNYTEYTNRLIYPMRAALPTKRSFTTDVFAMPGNHDWYEGLSTFSNIFMSGRKLGGWESVQKWSYFAIKLPHDWWMLCLDTALDSEIDNRQLEYFENIIRNVMTEKSKGIVCAPEPFWVYEVLKQKNKITLNLDYLTKRLLKSRYCPLYISGDLHHYRHHVAEDQNSDNSKPLPTVHYYTAGGGGAFIHPTHVEPCDSVSTNDGRDAYLKTEYPTKKDSRKLAYRNLLFIFYNPSFCLICAMLYLGVNLLLPIDHGDSDIFWGEEIFTSGTVWIAFLMMVSGTVLYGKSGSTKRYAPYVGFMHGICHIVAALFCSWVGMIVGDAMRDGLPSQLANIIVTLGLGAVVFSVVCGSYLLICQNMLSMHNGDFSAIIVCEYRHFLRMFFDDDGNVTIYSIGVDQPPSNWKLSSTPNRSRYDVDGGKDIEYHLLEDPVQIS